MEVSIIVTNYNYGVFLERCIRSCLNQHMPGDRQFEVIVVDDASTDISHELLKIYEDRVRVLLLTENKGIGYTSNYGIKNANGRFVVRVDADDYINEYMIMIQSLFLNSRKDYFGVSVDYYTVDATGDEKTAICAANEEPISCGIMYRKDVLIEEGLYDPDIRHLEEKELRTRLKEKYTIGNIPIPLYRYRKHMKNKTRNVDALNNVERQLKKKYGSK